MFWSLIILSNLVISFSFSLLLAYKTNLMFIYSYVYVYRCGNPYPNSLGNINDTLNYVHNYIVFEDYLTHNDSNNSKLIF